MRFCTMNDNTLYSEKESFNQQGYPDFYLKPNVINIGFRLFIALLAGSIPGFILIATLKLELFYLLPIDAICGGILIYWMLSSEHYFVGFVRIWILVLVENLFNLDNVDKLINLLHLCS